MAQQRRDADLTRYSTEQLHVLRRRIEAELERRADVQDRMERRRGGLREGTAPRYRNPDNASETWSGRGHRPAWVDRALERGRRLEDLEVDDDHPIPSDR